MKDSTIKLAGKTYSLTQRQQLRIQAPSKKDIEALLDLNTCNRPVTSGRIALLKRLLKEGHWIDDGDRIKVNCHGELVDGQHRLLAMIAAEVFPDFDLILGAHEDAFIPQGNQQPRSVAQSMAQAGIPNNRAVKSIMEIVLAGEPLNIGLYSAEEAINWGVANNHRVQEVIKFTRRFRSKLCAHSLAGALHFICAAHGDELRAQQFIAFIMGGEWDTTQSETPRSYKILRERLIRNATSQTTLGRRTIWAFMVKAYNNPSLGVLKWLDEIMPSIHVPTKCDEGCPVCEAK